MICSMDPQDPEDRGVGSDDLEGHGICRCCDVGHGIWSLGPRVKQQGAPGAPEAGVAGGGDGLRTSAQMGHKITSSGIGSSPFKLRKEV